MLDLSKLFGNKPWYQSLTAWGLVVGVGVTAMVGGACETGLVDAVQCDLFQTWSERIGVVMTMLGIRRAATSTNVR